jgi:hypothetical protein
MLCTLQPLVSSTYVASQLRTPPPPSTFICMCCSAPGVRTNSHNHHGTWRLLVIILTHLLLARTRTTVDHRTGWPFAPAHVPLTTHTHVSTFRVSRALSGCAQIRRHLYKKKGDSPVHLLHPLPLTLGDCLVFCIQKRGWAHTPAHLLASGYTSPSTC